jgi:SAM-dependent methyltransferase
VNHATWESAVQSLIDDPTQTEMVEACYFDPPLENAVRRFYNSDEWRSARAQLGPPRGRALDVGAGNGIVSCALARDGWRTVAMEPDPSDLVGRGAIRRASEALGLDVEVIDGTGECVPVADESFDLVVARQVLHHAQDLDAFCREIARVLRPGGAFFALRDHVVTGPEQLDAFFNSHPLHKRYGGENAFTEACYALAIESAGLRIGGKWRTFDAPFAYAPKSREDIARDIAQRVAPAPLRVPLAKVLAFPIIFAALAKALSTIDRRPGRVVCFLAHKR